MNKPQNIKGSAKDKSKGHMAPGAHAIEAQLEALQQAGLIAWSGKRLSPILAPLARTRRERTVAALLLKDRG